MGTLHSDGAKRLAKKLKRILQNEFGEDPRLGHCQQAIAEGFDFDCFSDMMRDLPANVGWHQDWCISALRDNGCSFSEDVAADAVSRLEELLGRVIAGGGGRDIEDEPHSLYD